MNSAMVSFDILMCTYNDTEIPSLSSLLLANSLADGLDTVSINNVFRKHQQVENLTDVLPRLYKL